MTITRQERRTALARTTQRCHTSFFRVPDDVNKLDFPLPGARLEPASVEKASGPNGLVAVTRISRGPGITDYVTHEPTFQYSSYGIHVSQDDRLTFFGDGQQLVVHLIDCREDSPRLGDEISIELTVSPSRLLIIPKGVAHTLDGLGGVVTRDEPIWYADSNPDWDPDNDLVSFPRAAESAPVVQTNRHQLPVAAHLLISRMSQRTNSGEADAYATRFRATVGGEVTYVTIRPDWRAVQHTLDPGGRVRRNNFVLTGPQSFTIVPSTDSCTSDVLELDLDAADSRFVKHDYSRRRLTWLTGSTDSRIEIVCPPSHRSRQETADLGDPTVGVVIPPGTWYRVTGSGRIWLRSEMELLDLAPASLSHPPGRDVVTSDSDAPGPSRPEQDDDRYLPGAALHALARIEAAAMSTTP